MDVHPFRAAWQTRDLQAWSEALSPEVVLHSPIIEQPFAGRDAVTDLYAVLFEALGPVTIEDELESADAHAFFWRADLDGSRVEGVDLLRADPDGAIVEIRVLIRPLVDIGAFAAAVGPHLAARHGALRGTLLRLVSIPLRLFLLVADRVATRLVGLNQP